MLRVLGQILPREVVVVASSEMLAGAVATFLALQLVAGASAMPTATEPGRIDLVLILIGSFGIAASVLGLYRSEALVALHSLFGRLLVAAVLALIVTEILPTAFHREFGALPHRGGAGVVAVAAAWLGCLIVIRAAFRAALQKQLLVRRILIIACDDNHARFERFITSSRHRRCDDIRLVKIGCDGSDDLRARLAPERLRRERLWGVVAAVGDDRPLPASLLLELRLRGIRVLTEAGFWEHARCWIDIDAQDVSWVLDRDGFRSGRVSDAAKRVLDIAVAAVLLGLTLPLMVVTAILIKCESAGPVLYRQERVGRGGGPFTLYKFRSMRQNAETEGTPQWASVGDPRITRVGRLIRYARIDELPQLFNVLRGDMSVVGPRPERPYFVDRLAAEIPFYSQRHCVKPGITGWAQVNAPYGASIEDARDKLRYDLYYVKNRSLLLDLWILASTIRTVLWQEGAR